MQQTDAADVYAGLVFLGIIRQQATRQHLQRGGLACTVVPEQAQHFAALQFQRHVINDREIAEAARQVACREGCFRSGVRQSGVSA